MSISIEWFLLDNTMMNLCIFLLASALSGTRVRFGPVCLFSIAGAVYALLSLFVWPWLGRLPVKLIAFFTLALPAAVGSDDRRRGRRHHPADRRNGDDEWNNYRNAAAALGTDRFINCAFAAAYRAVAFAKA